MRETRTPKYRGVFCPAITPFDESGRIDFTAAEELYDQLIRGGIVGDLGSLPGMLP